MSHLHLITGECHPRTEADLRIELAELAEDRGDYRSALEWRAAAARMRKSWAPGGTRVGLKPDDVLEPIGSPEHPLFICYSGPEDKTAVCACGHWATVLCDEPLGRGRTCDAPACDCCRVSVGEDLDRCAFHAAAAASR